MNAHETGRNKGPLLTARSRVRSCKLPKRSPFCPFKISTTTLNKSTSRTASSTTSTLDADRGSNRHRSIRELCNSSRFCTEWWENGAPEEIRTPAPQIRNLGRTIEIIEVCYRTTLPKTRFARPNIQIYDAHVADLYQWVCARYLGDVKGAETTAKRG